MSIPLVVIMRGPKALHSPENILECFRLSSVVQKHSAYRQACSKIDFRKVNITCLQFSVSNKGRDIKV